MVVKAKKEIMEKVREVHDAVMKINMFTELCAFFDDSGHIGAFCVSVAISKENYTTKIYSKNLVSYKLEIDEDDVGNEDAILDSIAWTMGPIVEVIDSLNRFASFDGNFSYMKIEAKDAKSYKEVYTEDADGFKEIAVDAVSDNYVYSIHGDGYEEVFIKIPEGVQDGSK